MRRLAALSFALILTFTIVLPAAAKEYLTEEELDIIRDAQELKDRVPAYFKLADKRLVILGVAEKSEKEKEAERKRQEQYEKEKQKAGDKADKVKKPVGDYDYLLDFTKAELLNGYIEVIDEVMSNLDDAYSRKLDVRDSLEDLAKFTQETLPKLEKFQPQNQAERTTLNQAIEKARDAQSGAKDALEKVPKTEKKKK